MAAQVDLAAAVEETQAQAQAQVDQIHLDKAQQAETVTEIQQAAVEERMPLEAQRLHQAKAVTAVKVHRASLHGVL
jgi:hypothetical protein